MASRNGFVHSPAYTVDAVDTTGAGDSFMGAIIHALTRGRFDADVLSESDLAEIADFACACASESAAKRGSLLVTPDMERVERTRSRVPKIEANLAHYKF
jgi:sugar/nucleoside kinase (ribokinase family)